MLYAVYQALPANRESPIFRAVGWWSAGAFLCNTIWNQIFISRQFVLSQLVIFCGLLCAGMAFFRFVQTAAPGRLTSIENWVVAPALGLLFGWLTAANVVGLASVLVANGFAPTGEGAETGGAALLLFGSAIAFFVVVFSRPGPSSAWVAYGATVIWALVAVFLEQSGASMLVGLAAVVGMVLVVAALVGPGLAHRGRTCPRGLTRRRFRRSLSIERMLASDLYRRGFSRSLGRRKARLPNYVIGDPEDGASEFIDGHFVHIGQRGPDSCVLWRQVLGGVPSLIHMDDATVVAANHGITVHQVALRSKRCLRQRSGRSEPRHYERRSGVFKLAPGKGQDAPILQQQVDLAVNDKIRYLEQVRVLRAGCPLL